MPQLNRLLLNGTAAHARLYSMYAGRAGGVTLARFLELAGAAAVGVVRPRAAAVFAQCLDVAAVHQASASKVLDAVAFQEALLRLAMVAEDTDTSSIRRMGAELSNLWLGEGRHVHMAPAQLRALCARLELMVSALSRARMHMQPVATAEKHGATVIQRYARECSERNWYTRELLRRERARVFGPAHTEHSLL
jgi:hypothetical protein